MIPLLPLSDLLCAIRIDWKRYVTCKHEYVRRGCTTNSATYVSLYCPKCGRSRSFNYNLVKK